MSSRYGGKIVTDGLVLCLDAHDAKSYAGEPTNNIQPNDASSRFTSSNSWGTFNTNQYNSGQYFSIGTISSVSNNIVTTSSNHPFRTFDAVRPQTTGGGVTAGTDYFIKKLSDTTFTIHAYNSSQDGTQGYIRSDGYHQVHESIATDTRISINSTNFPTMWWGAPHLPNTCHVKELRVGGGYRRGTNAMRVHVTRTVGVDGGMSYGVQPSGASIGDTVTSSWWARSSLPGTKTVQYYTYWGSGYAGSATNFTPTQEWQKFTHTWTASNTYNFIQYWFQGATSTPWWFEVADLQTEINKSYSTPYTLPSSPRSATNGWVDRSGNSNSGTLTNMTGTGTSHYRDGQVIMPIANSYLDFDGTNDELRLTSYNDLRFGDSSYSDNFSIEVWFKLDTIARSPLYDYYRYGLQVASDGTIGLWYNGNGGTWGGSGYGGSISAGVWYHGLGVHSEGNHDTVYLNGTAVSTDSTPVDIGSSTYPWSSYPYVGHTDHVGGVFTNGQIAVVRVYNKALTAAEVLSNYNATKGRFS